MREVWKDGIEREVVRDRGRFVSIFVVPEEPLFYRASVGLNFVIKGKYFGAIIQEWFDSEEEAWLAIDRLKEDLIRMVERYVGYPEGEWWFSTIIGEGVQEVNERHTRYATIEEA